MRWASVGHSGYAPINAPQKGENYQVTARLVFYAIIKNVPRIFKKEPGYAIGMLWVPLVEGHLKFDPGMHTSE